MGEQPFHKLVRDRIPDIIRADVAEVLQAIDEVLHSDARVVEVARQEKATTRGGFAGRLYLEKIVSHD